MVDNVARRAHQVNDQAAQQFSGGLALERCLRIVEARVERIARRHGARRSSWHSGRPLLTGGRIQSAPCARRAKGAPRHTVHQRRQRHGIIAMIADAAAAGASQLIVAVAAVATGDSRCSGGGGGVVGHVPQQMMLARRRGGQHVVATGRG